jgi:hypothetical protein
LITKVQFPVRKGFLSLPPYRDWFSDLMNPIQTVLEAIMVGEKWPELEADH